MVRRIIRNLQLDIIAAVDRPCQEHARMTIIKREAISGSGPGDTEENNMTTVTKQQHDEALAALVATHKTETDTLKGRLAKLENDLLLNTAKAAMCDDEKEHFEGLDEEKKKAFIALSPAARKAEAVSKRSGDETIVVAGRTIRKSVVGVDTFEVMKAQQAQIEANAGETRKAKEDAELARMEKRAVDEFPNVVGTPVLKAKVLKAMAGQPEDVRTAFEAILKSAQGTNKGAFDRLGSEGGKQPAEVSKARSNFEAKVSLIMGRDKVTKLVAMRKAQAEFPEEFEAYQSLGEPEDQAAAA